MATESRTRNRLWLGAEIVLCWFAISASLFAWRAATFQPTGASKLQWKIGHAPTNTPLVVIDARRGMTSHDQRYETLAEWSASLPERLPAAVQLQVDSEVPTGVLREVAECLAIRGVRQLSVSVKGSSPSGIGEE